MKNCVEEHDFEQLLKGVNLRLTKGRLAVLSALHTNGALSADELRAASKNMFDRVTAYRTLKQLVTAGVLVPSARSDGAARYELADHHRHSLVCTQCGLSEILPECGVERLQKEVLQHSRSFSAVRAHAVEFFGICTTCAHA